MGEEAGIRRFLEGNDIKICRILKERREGTPLGSSKMCKNVGREECKIKELRRG